MLQYFIKKNFKPGFKSEEEPKLLYVSRIEEEDSVYPRVMHSHEDSVEIVLIYSGKGQYIVEGKSYNIKKGDLIIYNSGIIHDEPSGPNVKIGSFCCAVGDININGLRRNALVKDSEGPIFSSGVHFDAMMSVYELMFKELSLNSKCAEESCHYLMMTLLSLVWNIVHKKTEKSNEETIEIDLLAQRIKNYIDENYYEDISLQTISEALNISTYYLAHVFKKATGYSPLQYILRRRIGEAQTLLISTDLPATVIAAKVGYNNPSHFNLIFTKNVGMSPRKYRKNYSSIFKKDEQ